MVVAAGGASLATLSSLSGGPILPTSAAIAIMAVALAIRLELRIDPRSRRYQRLDGIWPALSNRRGTLDELRWIHIDVFETTTHIDAHGRETIARSYTVQLAWGREHPAPPWTLYKGARYAEAAAKAQEFATELELPVVEGASLRRIRAELGPSAYDARLELPSKNRMIGLTARLRP
jgi:hypothetical protein